MARRSRRRLLGVLVALTVALALLDVAGSEVPQGIRALSATVLGPAQRALSVAPADEVAALQAENTRLRTQLRQLEHDRDQATEARSLLASGVTGSRELVAARVVATEASPGRGRAVMIDAGARDGVVVDSTVVTAEGLVGRIVAVQAWTSEVQVLGSPGATVGVRVGAGGTLGVVRAGATSGVGARPPGALTLELVQPGRPVVGDEVSTLGSVGDRPYVAGVPVGRVVAVDPDRGLPTRSATVEPAVDLDALDVVAVVAGSPRTAAKGDTR